MVPGMDVDSLTFFATVGGAVVTVIVAVVGVGIALARLIKGETARIDADRQAADTRHATDMREFRSAMDTFRTEMLRLAERQSHVEGRLDERRSAAD